MEKYYACIDLKSFYASVECRDRGLDPMVTNLVVADKGRTEKTICLAVTPPLKAYGLSGRSRLYEVISTIQNENYKRRMALSGAVQSSARRLVGSSYNDAELKSNPTLAIDYIVAPPRMAHYMEVSTQIYNIYLNHVAHEDIHAYSIDEVFIDITPYLSIAKSTPHDFVRTLIRDVYKQTGITATAGIGTNLYLAKIAMDIVAKHIPADSDGVRIAELDEMSYRRLLWSHRPLTDFWRVGRGYAQKLEKHGLYTMGDVARCSLGKPTEYHNEELLYKLFGVNAELLIDHAWGWEPCTIAEIKAYKPQSNSIGSGQVLTIPYTADKARLVIREMTDALVLDLVDKGLVTDQLVLTVGYDIENLTTPDIKRKYKGEIVTDRYGRQIPKHSHGTANLDRKTSSTALILDAVTQLYDRIVNKNLLIRRLNITACRVVDEKSVTDDAAPEQMSMFVDYAAEDARREQEKIALEREKKVQKTLIDIKKKHGKNAIVKGMNLEQGATAMERNKQIGGHKA